ncbi:MAG: AraC family transcriptional regulator [Bacteroidales bacterium]|nr:AraC family transcriptional regulator [Bacteroidales bacterium]
MKGIEKGYADYISRINKSLDFMEANLQNQITLEDLAGAANFSKFHFSRIFQAYTGQSPYKFMMRLRLEKAASMIISNKNESITDIAFKCGYADITAFSKCFKDYFKVTAKDYRCLSGQKSNNYQLKRNMPQAEDVPEMYFCPESKTFKWRAKMKLNKSVEVKELSGMTVAYVRNIGPYDGNQEVFGTLRNKLFSWAAARNLIGGGDFTFLVVYHDDPTVALSEQLRMSLCLKVKPETKVDGEIGKMDLNPGKYAVARFELRGPEFQQAWDWLYGQWMPVSGFQPDDRPYFEMYLHEPVEGNYLVDFCVPVRPA